MGLGSTALSEFLGSGSELAVMPLYALCLCVSVLLLLQGVCVTASTGYFLQHPVSDECANIGTRVSIILFVVIVCCIIFLQASWHFYTEAQSTQN